MRTHSWRYLDHKSGPRQSASSDSRRYRMQSGWSRWITSWDKWKHKVKVQWTSSMFATIRTLIRTYVFRISPWWKLIPANLTSWHLTSNNKPRMSPQAMTTRLTLSEASPPMLYRLTTYPPITMPVPPEAMVHTPIKRMLRWWRCATNSPSTDCCCCCRTNDDLD